MGTFIFFTYCLFLGKTVAAIYRTLTAGLERNLAGCSALCAYSIIHLAGFAALAIVLASIAACLATLGLIGETLLSVKFLLSGSESEFLSAFLADECLVSVHVIPR